MIDGKNFFDQQVKHKLMTYMIIKLQNKTQKTAAGQRDDYKTIFLEV